MKRKFSFSLPPLKIPSRAETRALKEALNGNFDFETTPISPPSSPFINRQPIDWRTEAQLRTACAAVVDNYSEEEPQAALNFQPLHATEAIHKNDEATVAPKEVRPHGPTNPQSNQRSSHHMHKQHSKPDVRSSEDSHHTRSAQSLPHGTLRPHRELSHDSFVPRDGPSFPVRKDSVRAHTITNLPLNPLLMSPPDRPRTAPLDNSSDESSASPMTASTDRHFNYASTAITSADITPSHISKRASKLILDNESYKAAQNQADAEAAAWMRQELDKRRQHAQRTQAPQPPPSRSSARAWVSDIRDFVRPGSSSGVRPSSRETHSRHDSGSVRSTSAQGWRSWGGLRRKSSKSSLTEFSSEATQIRNADQKPSEAGRKEINLNRELPPLPSLDTWKEPQPKPQPSCDTHIASLMKASKSKSGKAASRPRKSMATDPDRPATRPIVPASKSMPHLRAPVPAPMPERERRGRTEPIQKSQVRKISATHHSKTSSIDSCFSPASSNSIGASHSVDLRRTAERLEKQESNVDLHKVSERLEKHERLLRHKSLSKSTHSLTHQRHLSDSTNQTRPTTRDGKTLNFSRKISIDSHGPAMEVRYPNVVEITALPPMPSRKQGSRLRRALSKLDMSSRSGRQQKTWMDKIEADGVKSGVMVADEPAATPTIKY